MVVTLAACAPPPLLGVGRASEAASPPVAKPGVDGGAAISPIAADYATRLARVGPDSFVSAGHAAGRYAATVSMTREAKDLVATSKPFPMGTEIVMATLVPSGHAAGPTFFMLKRPTGWTFGVVESPNARPDEVVLCARCHAEAPHDEVFALPE